MIKQVIFYGLIIVEPEVSGKSAPTIIPEVPVTSWLACHSPRCWPEVLFEIEIRLYLPKKILLVIGVVFLVPYLTSLDIFTDAYLQQFYKYNAAGGGGKIAVFFGEKKTPIPAEQH